MDWEGCKENFAPVRTGRSKAVLSEVHDAADSASKVAVLNKLRELEKDIRDYAGDDPLEPWLRLIKWKQEHLNGGSKAQLQEVIEKCTQALSHLGSKYHSDVRYLRLWIQYADCLADPADVFFFLRDKQIGHEYALFYEAHATHYELRGNCSAADAVYQEGINRCAKPVERLKQKYVAFQTRMAQRIQRKIQEEGLLQSSAGEARSSFASLRQTQPASAHSSRAPQLPGTSGAPQLLGVVPAFASGAAAPATKLPLPSLSHPNSASGSSGLPSLLPGHRPHLPLPIAVDDEFRGRPAAEAPPSFLGLPQGQGSAKAPKPYSLTHKENSEQPSIWTAASLPQSKATSSGFGTDPGGGGKLEICVDDEFLEGEEPLQAEQQQQQQRQAQARSFFDQQLAPEALGSTASSITAGLPLAAPVPKAPVLRGVQQAGPAPASALKADQPPDSKKAGPCFGYDATLLVGPGGQEQSFEEARAAMFLARQAHQSVPASTASAPGPLKPWAALSASSTDLGQPPALAAASGNAQQQQQTAASAASAGGQRRAPFGSGTHMQLSQPSVSTAAAPAFPGRKALAPQPLPQSGPGAGKQGMVQGFPGSMPARAGDTAGYAASSSLQHGASGRSLPPPSLPFEPTVTISTKAAFDILNDMFNDELPHGSSDTPSPTAPAPAGAAAAAPITAGRWSPQRYAAPTCLPAAYGSGSSSLGGSHPSMAPMHAPEPTVTISTRAAFDALNDMFCDQLPHEDRLRQPKALGGAGSQPASKPLKTSDVCRLANGTRPGARLPAAAAPPPAPLSALMVHEDTEFGISALMGGGHVPAAMPPSGMCIYEDTDMLGVGAGMHHPGSAAAYPSMMLHEDTEFMTRDIVDKRHFALHH